MTKKIVRPIVSNELGYENVVCVDQSYTRTGFAVWNINKGTLLNFQDVSFDKDMDNRGKRSMIAKAVKSLVETFACSAVVLEEARMFPSAQTKARLHEINAIISSTVSVPCYEINTTSYKSLTAGYRSDKQQAIDYVKDKFMVIANDDIADAILMGEALHKGIKLKRFY